jgi:hypothetical protein
MKLLLIYGPPAAGKLTVANEVAARIGYKVFHNHLTIDAITPVFDFDTPSFGRLVSRIRVDTMAEAARENVDLIYTFCYAKGSDDSHIARVVEAVEGNGGEVCPVLLQCSLDELYRRISMDSRMNYTKIKDRKLLDEIPDKHDLFSTIPEPESLVVDNTDLGAAETADLIIEHYKLI